MQASDCRSIGVFSIDMNPIGWSSFEYHLRCLELHTLFPFLKYRFKLLCPSSQHRRIVLCRCGFCAPLHFADCLVYPVAFAFEQLQRFCFGVAQWHRHSDLSVGWSDFERHVTHIFPHHDDLLSAYLIMAYF